MRKLISLTSGVVIISAVGLSGILTGSGRFTNTVGPGENHCSCVGTCNAR